MKGSLIISSAETTYDATGGSVDTITETEVTVRRGDPLAQSFTTDETGAFLSSVDLFFASTDPSQKVRVQVRTVELGLPTRILAAPHAEAEITGSSIVTSTDATVATKVRFPSPDSLLPDQEYSIVVLAPQSNLFELWIARMGERTVNTTTLPDAESVLVTKQYIGGSLYKSQNGTIWTPSQFEDMKFKLYKCNFTSSSGTAFFYNPKQDINNQSSILPADPIKTLPRKLKVEISNTTVMNSILIPGAKVSDETTSTAISGIVEKAGGTANAMTKLSLIHI